MNTGKINQRQWDDLFAWFIANTEEARMARKAALGALLLSAGKEEKQVQYVCELCKRVSERLFSCDHCEGGNRLCDQCMSDHEAAGHESDSSTASERTQGIHIVGGRE